MTDRVSVREGRARALSTIDTSQAAASFAGREDCGGVFWTEVLQKCSFVVGAYGGDL